MNDSDETDKAIRSDRAVLIHRWTMRVLHASLAIGLVLAIFERQWLSAMAILAIFAVTFLPSFAFRHLRVYIPPEFELLAIVFVYAALFLGEVLNYYQRFWWWDIALHATSGLLLGIFGFLLIYVLNEDDQVDLHMRPRFVAIFAFVFALAVGALWEIFEFSMDQIFGMNMQKPMFGDPSGLTDTMWDLIVDAAGALLISVFGWWYLKRPERSFIELWIAKFLEGNPHLFRSRGGR
ncbi:MAG TPA: hypothetical protein VMS12_03715 [Thermoanaerobaculia bacterium]|nr:hypothetical protein [Thermoanaerobaculia bacterium]